MRSAWKFGNAAQLGVTVPPELGIGGKHPAIQRPSPSPHGVRTFIPFQGLDIPSQWIIDTMESWSFNSSGQVKYSSKSTHSLGIQLMQTMSFHHSLPSPPATQETSQATPRSRRGGWFGRGRSTDLFDFGRLAQAHTGLFLRFRLLLTRAGLNGSRRG